MGFQGVDRLMHFLKRRYLCYIGGEYGEGKTALAVRLAIELRQKHGYRYIFSNVHGLVFDDPSKVEFRPDHRGIKKYVDGVLVLDEAGEFMAFKKDLKGWLSYLRKINVIILMPSKLEVHDNIRGLEVRRIWDGHTLGLEMYRYGIVVDSAAEKVKVKDKFNWWYPSEIYGVYDTDGIPSDANEILEHFTDWLRQYGENTGYTATATKLATESAQVRGSRQIFKESWDAETSEETGQNS